MATKKFNNPDGARFYHINGNKYVSTTTVCRVLPKPFLFPWYAKMEKQAVGNLMMKITDHNQLRTALTELIDGPTAASVYIEKTAKFGNKIHSTIESFFNHKNPAPKLRKRHKKSIAQFQDWWKDAGITPVKGKSEFVVHDKVEIVAGTVDLLGKKDKKLIVIDWKTGSGIFLDAYYQVVIYIMCLQSMGMDVKEGLLVHIPRDGSKVKAHKVIPGKGQAPSIKKAKQMIHFWWMLNEKRAA